MKRIRVLDGLVASKIAAGEVIERPASVVKELIENSLDAGATSISLKIEKGGRSLIRVQDNGCGISPEDAGLAILRHATSKIREEGDLLRVKTLGFRGEALASIAAVSRLTITTREHGKESGVRLTMEGGGEPRVSPTGCGEGTTVAVRDLFFNTPARLKFLRSPQTESGRIIEVFRTLALANPHVRFSLERDAGRDIFLPAGGQRERLVSLLGEGRPMDLIPLESTHVEGFIGRPEEARASRRAMYIYLNRRPIRDKTVVKALIDGYGRLIERPGWPRAFINLMIPPSDVDVNIHPAKTEVRFQNTGGVYSLVRGAVQKAIAMTFTGGGGPAKAIYGGTTAHTARPPGVGEAAGPSYAPMPEGQGFDGALGKGLFREAPTGDVRNPEFLGLRVRGQLWDEFLLAESCGDDRVFYIIDQHGAEERGAYERLKRDYYTSGLRRQLLLIPERVETTAEEAEALERAMEDLERLGFEVTYFGPSPMGGGTFIIKSIPHILPPRETGALIRALAVDISREGGSARVEERIEKALMTIACHSVIRGARRLTVEEGEEVLKNLSRMDFAGYCPHGRPVVKRLTRREVEAFFKR